MSFIRARTKDGRTRDDAGLQAYWLALPPHQSRDVADGKGGLHAVLGPEPDDTTDRFIFPGTIAKEVTPETNTFRPK